MPNIRGTPLPYSTLNEILQGFETPAAALLPSSTPSIITAPTATSFIDLLTGGGIQSSNQPQTSQQASTHHHNHPTNAINNTNSNNTLATLNNQDFLVNLNSYTNDGFGENIGNGTTNLYIIRTPLARWNEECTVLDSHSMHHAILLNKPKIMEALEKYRNDELNEKREKKLKEEKEKEKEKEKLKKTTEAAEDKINEPTAASSAPAATSSESCIVFTDNPASPTDMMVTNAQSDVQIEELSTVAAPQPEQAEQAMVVTDSEAITTVETPLTSVIITATQEPATEMTEVSSNQTASALTETLSTPAASAQPAARTGSPQFATAAEHEFYMNFVGATCSVFTITSADEGRVAARALRMAEHQRAALEFQAATANESTTYPQNYVLLDGHCVELPSGIDPSFLGALPDSLRKEVIMEQLRVQGKI